MRDLLGNPDPADAALAFGSIADQVPDEAAALRDILRLKSVEAETGAFDILDELANNHRQSHQNRIQRGLGAVLMSAVFAGLAIVVSILFASTGQEGHATDYRRIFTFLQFGALFVGVFLFGLDSRRNGNDSWKRVRAQAETHRLKQFVAVLQAPLPDGTDLKSVLPLQLAFVRRYLWQAQLFYIEGKLASADDRRTRQKAGMNWVRVGILLAAGSGVLLGIAELTALSGWFGGQLGAALDAQWAVVSEGFASAVAVIALGVIAHRHGSEGFHRDSITRQRLEATQIVLRLLGGTWEEPSDAYLRAEAAALEGNRGPVRDWLDAIMSAQESEHHEWLEEMDRAVPASTDALSIWRVLKSE